MMTTEQFVALVAGQGDDLECVRDLRQALASQIAWDGPALTRAGNARGIFAARRLTTREVGINTRGFAETLERLGALPPDTTVLTWHGVTPEWAFQVFVDERTGRLLGCIAVTRQRGFGLRVPPSVVRAHLQAQGQPVTDRTPAVGAELGFSFAEGHFWVEYAEDRDALPPGWRLRYDNSEPPAAVREGRSPYRDLYSALYHQFGRPPTEE